MGARAVGLASDPDIRPTTGQQAVRERFKLAAICGKTLLADAAAKALYEVTAKSKGISVFA